MAHLTYPFTITPNTLASASQVMGNFDAIKAILNGGIDGTNLADGAVTSGKLASKAVDTSALADGAVSEAKLAAESVATAKLADGSVTNAKLAENAVDTGNLRDDAVTTAKIAAGAVATDQLANAAVTRDKLADDAQTLLGGVLAYGVYAKGAMLGDGINISESRLPDGWSVQQFDEGYFRITHNLNREDYEVLVPNRMVATDPDWTVKLMDSSPTYFVVASTGPQGLYTYYDTIFAVVLVPPPGE